MSRTSKDVKGIETIIWTLLVVLYRFPGEETSTKIKITDIGREVSKMN